MSQQKHPPKSESSVYLDDELPEIFKAIEDQMKRETEQTLKGFRPADLNKGGDRMVERNKPDLTTMASGEVVSIKTGEVLDAGTVTYDLFPFTLNDLESWIIKRKDGTVIKYILDTGDKARVRALSDVKPGSVVTKAIQKAAGYITAGGVSDYCHHNPKDEPTWEDPEGRFSLHIADEFGAKQYKDKFDMVLDAAGVVPGYLPFNTLQGDSEMVGALSKYDISSTKPRILRFSWADRQAPNLHPGFWQDITKFLKGRVIVNCQGGHGRSGSIIVCIMLAQTDYSALDAITHLRAVHCARAIESVIQHEYINWVAEYYGRGQDALEDSKVKSFRARFLDEMTSTFAQPYQARLSK